MGVAYQSTDKRDFSFEFLSQLEPYGYRAYKLPGVKGSSPRIEPEEAKVVQMIYDMYGKQGMGYNGIAYALNDMHIPARKRKWGQTSIVNILTNEVYLGKIRWRREPVKKVDREAFLITMESNEVRGEGFKEH